MYQFMLCKDNATLHGRQAAVFNNSFCCFMTATTLSGNLSKLATAAASCLWDRYNSMMVHFAVPAPI